MFGFFKSEEKKLREAGKNWLYLGDKVYHFRKDQLSDTELDGLVRGIEDLKVQLKSKEASSSKLKYAIDTLESHLKQIGGAFYPRSSIGENVDFFFMALIIYLGVTAFFVKPFKIPTNSMFPTYYGMTEAVWQTEDDEPRGLNWLFRLAAFGSIRYKIEAPADGELLIPIQMDSNYGGSSFSLLKSVVPKRRFIILPGKGIGHWFQIGGETVELKTPLDFTIEEDVLSKAWFPESSSFYSVIRTKLQTGQYKMQPMQVTVNGRQREVQVAMVRTGKRFKKGETVLSFDILTGDQLFVDRIGYHFKRPEVGDGFVFRTANIPQLGEDKFYIKRLVGTPGDTLQIQNSSLLVNGQPAEGSIAFAKNADQEGDYGGYQNTGNLSFGDKLTIPEDSYYALGDNSFNSRDSRYWGFVPESEIVGRPVMIYYPFTRRFGLAK